MNEELERRDLEPEEGRAPEETAAEAPPGENAPQAEGTTAKAEVPRPEETEEEAAPPAGPSFSAGSAPPQPDAPAPRQPSYYQGNGYYAPPQQPYYPPQPGPGGPYTTGWQQPPYPQGQPYGGAPGWQQLRNGPYTTGWQQPPRQSWPTQGGYDPAGGWNPQPSYQPPRQQYQPQNPTPGRWEQPAAAAPSAAPPKKKKRRVLRVLLALLLILAGLAVLGAAGYGIYAAVSGENPLGGDRTEVTTPGGLPDVGLNDKPENAKDDYSGAVAGSLSNTEIFQKVSPSVVAIIARSGASVYGGQSQGTGIIMSEDGYIITNAHLVTDRDNFEVILTDGESHRAEVVGSDRNNDLAVLKVNATGLTAAEFGNSEQTQVGERVCVIGNPGGLRFQNSLTVGYVSALNRAVYIGNYTINCIQTDAAINPGNSGGPLINAYGQVIGISSAKIALEEYEGICFAIPISEAMPILQQLISDGKVTGRAMLGITATPVKATEAEFYEIPLGLWVKGVTPGSDIARKGVREGDIITHLAGQPIYTLDACAGVLRDYAPGDTIQVTVFRREGSITDNTFTVDVILEAS